MIKPLLKLGGTALGLLGLYEGYEYYKAKKISYTLAVGQKYSIVANFSGAGVGGMLTLAQIQTYVDAAMSPGTLRVDAAIVDQAKKTVTMTVDVERGPELVAASSNNPFAAFPSAFGSWTLGSCSSLGKSTTAMVTSAAPQTSFQQMVDASTNTAIAALENAAASGEVVAPPAHMVLP